MHNNREILRKYETVWYDALMPKKDGFIPSDEQIEKTNKNAKRNAKRSLEFVLQDRIQLLATLPPNDRVSEEITQARKQLEELQSVYPRPRIQRDRA